MTTSEQQPVSVDRIAEIRARTDAATFGPWAWFGNTDAHNMYLSTVEGGRVFVLRFERWGMQHARPVFAAVPTTRDPRESQRYTGPMVPGDRLARYEVCPDATSRDDERVYRADLSGIRHPDAEFIAHAREDVPVLLAEIDRLRALLGEDPVPEVEPVEYGEPSPPAPEKRRVRHRVRTAPKPVVTIHGAL